MLTDYTEVEEPTGTKPTYAPYDPPALVGTSVLFPGALYFAATQAAYYCVDPRTRFRRHAHEWHAATDHLSAPTQIAMHPDYQKIIGMGPTALPFILEDLRDQGGEWFWALRSIAESSPVPDHAAGNIPLMKMTWLRWGVEHGYILPT